MLGKTGLIPTRRKVKYFGPFAVEPIIAIQSEYSLWPRAPEKNEIIEIRALMVDAPRIECAGRTKM
jgi:hypothetical protein